MLSIIINDIYASFIEYIGFAVGYSVLVTLIGYIHKMFLIPKSNNVQAKHSLWRFVLLFVFNSYIFLIISITILSREPGSRTEVNLMIFDTFSKNLTDNIFPIENMLLFIPFGLLLPLLSKTFRTVIRIMELGIISSLLIEGMQYITQRGYFQTDDIIMNVLGTLVGYLIFIAVHRCHKSIP